MAEEFLWIMGSAIVDALLGFVGVFSLWLSNKDMKKIANILMAFAAGSLLGGAFIHLLPESLESMDGEIVLLTALAGFILFIFLESYVHWHHCKECDIHPFSYVMMIGDGVHNFLGGLVLAASFLISIPLGIATMIAIIAHELPQQLGIFGVLVKGGLPRNKAIIYSFIAQSTIILGALVGYLLSGMMAGITAFLVPFAAGNFIYIAASDLIPEMHKAEGWDGIKNILIFFVGIVFMWILKVYGAG
ncbi:ZIP family metal transporter [Candidatus Micrarchaeota archaeon]|nr:ZIP family metal transporter [Candidatus Micrarchaeota archaeon]